MKAKMILTAAALAALAILSAGCKKQVFYRIVPGEQIQFKATSNASLSTKTAYSGVYFSAETGADYDYKERIDWGEDDEITIAYVSFGGNDGLCADSDTYKVTGVSNKNTESSFATIAPTGGPYGGNGLVWRDNAVHQFYACYPGMDKDEEYSFVSNGSSVSAVVPFDYPQNQVVTRSASDENVFLPDMSHAALLSNNGVSVSLPAGAEKVINLPFEPHFTAFEIQVAAKEGDSFKLKDFTLTSASDNITGRFLWTLDPSTGDWNDVDKAGNVYKTAAVDFSSFNITLTDAQTITFTVIVREVSLYDPTISFNIENGEGVTLNRSLKLTHADGTSLRFAKKLKHRIYGLRIPLDLTTEPDGWFEATNAGGYTNQDW